MVSIRNSKEGNFDQSVQQLEFGNPGCNRNGRDLLSQTLHTLGRVFASVVFNEITEGNVTLQEVR
jgi:hypothetical protein